MNQLFNNGSFAPSFNETSSCILYVFAIEACEWPHRRTILVLPVRYTIDVYLVIATKLSRHVDERNNNDDIGA